VLRSRLVNPAFMMTEALPLSQITTLNYCTSAKGVFDDTTPAQMHEAMIAYQKVCDQKTLALFFHGGLVDKRSGLDNAKQLLSPYADTSLKNNKAGNAYPYFFVWESGLFETLQHNLPEIVAETIFQRLRDIIGSKAQAVLGGAPPPSAQAMSLRMPTIDVTIPPVDQNLQVSQADVSDVQQSVENDPLINAEKLRITRSAIPTAQAFAESTGMVPREVRTSAATLLSPEVVSAIVAEEAHKVAITPQAAQHLWSPNPLGSLALGAGQVLVRIVERYASGRNHNFHNTIVEEIFRQYYIANAGWAIWHEMKFETAQAFQGDAMHNVGTAMVGELLGLYESGDAGLNARITLLGHSTGAIYICNFLEALDAALQSKAYADKIKVDVIFMAPAVRANMFAQTLSAHGRLIRNFRAFEMEDALEADEKLLQLDNPPNSTVNPLLAQIYTSSLLYFVAGVLEDADDDTPIAGMQRYFERGGSFAPGAFPVLDSIWTFYSGLKHPVIYSDTRGLHPQPPLGQRCTSHHHGGFPSDDPAPIGGTLESVCYLLKTGDYA
jgi:hypothetical protein